MVPDDFANPYYQSNAEQTDGSLFAEIGSYDAKGFSHMGADAPLGVVDAAYLANPRSNYVTVASLVEKEPYAMNLASVSPDKPWNSMVAPYFANPHASIVTVASVAAQEPYAINLMPVAVAQSWKSAGSPYLTNLHGDVGVASMVVQEPYAINLMPAAVAQSWKSAGSPYLTNLHGDVGVASMVVQEPYAISLMPAAVAQSWKGIDSLYLTNLRGDVSSAFSGLAYNPSSFTSPIHAFTHQGIARDTACVTLQDSAGVLSGLAYNPSRIASPISAFIHPRLASNPICLNLYDGASARNFDVNSVRLADTYGVNGAVINANPPWNSAAHPYLANTALTMNPLANLSGILSTTWKATDYLSVEASTIGSLVYEKVSRLLADYGSFRNITINIQLVVMCGGNYGSVTQNVSIYGE